MNKPGQKTAMISSTSLDLSRHRQEVENACLRLGIFPIGMEHLPARDADAIRVSLEMVDKADIYIGIFAWRYGYRPEGHDVSITEMEFNRAVERKIPILVFLIHKEHPLTIEMVETDKDAQKKLAELKDRASEGRGRRQFKSPDDLRGEVIHALSDLQKRELESSGEKAVPDFHPLNFIPKPPEPYIAHPYSLLQTKDVVGRQAELNLLTDWVTTNKQMPADARIFNLVAIGGMGKSALTWKWFNDIAPNELPKLAGRLWWSFYESDAHWENFIIRALAYVSGQSEQAVREMKSPDREDQLWRVLDQQPFLLVLDGLERILLAYARMDAAQMLDEDLDDKTANRVVQDIGLPPSAADFFIGKHQLRLTADHRAGHFLRRLARVRNSRILITTRLYPAELQCETGAPLPGCSAQFLTGLTDSDALNLWREFKVTGSSEQLLPLFRSFGNYPLLIRALAGEVAAFRGGPGDFDKWRAQNPDFDPTRLPLKNAKTHVLEFALRGLKPEHRQVLHTIAAFRMPATWDTLRALLVEQERGLKAASTPDEEGTVKRAEARAPKPCATDQSLDLILTELEDRGLVGWDKKANRYDLHPIVRGVVWATLDSGTKELVHDGLSTFFEAIPKPEWHEIQSVDELTPAIELYNSLIALRRYDYACSVFFDHLDAATHDRLGASRLRIDLLQPLVDGSDGDYRLSDPSNLCSALNALGKAHTYFGEPLLGVRYQTGALCLSKQSPLLSGPYPWCVCDLSNALRPIGQLRAAVGAAMEAVRLWRPRRDPFQEVRSDIRLGLAFSACGNTQSSLLAMQRGRRISETICHDQSLGFVCSGLAQRSIWLGKPQGAFNHAKRAGELALSFNFERDFVRAARLRGAVAMALGDAVAAAEYLHYALTRARAVNFIEEELPALVALAELRLQRKEYATARELLEQVWASAERGPYPLLHADALNVLVQIERDQGNREAAIAAATKAYTLAWCDGISADGRVCYAYHYGLTNARQHLRELGVPEPQLLPFDESKFEAMPDVELNPKDEFWVDPDKLDSP